MRQVFTIALLTMTVIVAFNDCPQASDYPGYAKVSVSSNGSVSGMSDNLGGSSNESGVSAVVNLYSGQHQESFPLFVLPGRAGLGISFGLDYSGNVGTNMQRRNDESQAGPFGLGFSAGLEAITVNDMGTIEICDDKYFYVCGSSSSELVRSVYSSCNDTVANYAPLGGAPWVVVRHMTFASGAEVIKGWTVKKEDGTVYRFGDFVADGSSRSATRYKLRWGKNMSIGFSDDELYPYRWDLAQIHDTDSANVVHFYYSQQLDRVSVGYTAGGLSNNYYTRSSYLERIVAPGGYKAEFSTEARDDYVGVLNGSHYHIYEDRCYSLIEIENPSSAGIVEIDFDYVYLNSAAGDLYKKRVLTSIGRQSTGASVVMPRLQFAYCTDDTCSGYGSIKLVTRASGGVQEIQYKTIEADSNYAVLCDTFVAPHSIWSNMCDIGSNMFVSQKDRSGDNLLIKSNWNGYWESGDNPYASPHNKFDCPAVSSGGWSCWYHRGGNGIVVDYDEGGGGKSEVITPGFAPSGDWIRLVAGNDFIVALDMISGAPNPQVRYAYLYKRVNGSWIGPDTVDLGSTGQIASIDVSPDMFLLHNYFLDAQSHLKQAVAVGRFDYSTNTWQLSLFNNENHIWDPYEEVSSSLGTNFAVFKVGTGQNLYTDSAWQKINLVEWTDAGFQHTVVDSGLKVSDSTGPPWNTHVRRLGNPQAMGDVVWWKYSESQDPDHRHYIKTMIKSDTGWVTQSMDLGTYAVAVVNDDAWTSGRVLAAIDHYDDVLTLWEWNGSDWDTTTFGDINGDMRQIKVRDNIVCALVQPVDSNSNGNPAVLMARGRTGGSTWSSLDTLLTGVSITYDLGYEMISASIACEEDYIVAYGVKPGVSGVHTWVFKWDGVEWTAINLDSALPSYEGDYVYSTPGSFFIVIDYVLYSFRWYKDQCYGKAEYPVVDRVLYKAHPADGNPIVRSYSYAGGILDRSASTPRFARTTDAVPFYLGDSTSVEGFISHHFYNDLFAEDEAWSELDTQIGLPSSKRLHGYACMAWAGDVCLNWQQFPDWSLSVPDTSWLDEMEAHLFDGLEYLTVSYTAPGQSGCLDSIRTEYTVYERFPSFETTIRRVHEDHVRTRTRGIARDRFLEYGSNCQPIRVITQMADSGYLVDDVHFAYSTDPVMSNDNAIVQASEVAEYFVNTAFDTTSYFVRSGTQYGLFGGWRPTSEFSYRDMQSLTDTVVSNTMTYGFDGNLLTSTDAGGTVTTNYWNSAGLHIDSVVAHNGGESLRLKSLTYNTFGQVATESGSDGFLTKYFYDDLGRLDRTQDNASNLVQRVERYYSRDGTSGAYSVSDPNFVKTTSYRSNVDSTTTISFSDGLGRGLHNRTTSYDGTSPATLVTGLSEYDSRGRQVKTYLPYYDYVSGVGTCELTNTAIDRAKDYYDGDPRASCGDTVYTEQVFLDSVGSRLVDAIGPGNSSQNVHYGTSSDAVNEYLIDSIVDADGLVTVTTSDTWSGRTTTVNSCTDELGITTVYTTTHRDLMGREIDTYVRRGSADSVKLQQTTYNDLGQVTSTWKVDYGTINMLYDKNGNLRFMQNDKRLGEGNFVYYKYDFLGRKIEEGLCSGQLSQTNADDPSFPASGNTVAYRRYYDQYLSNIALGRLVRVENDDATYYKNIYYPSEYRDSVEVRLPGLISIKKYAHTYNRDGTVSSLSVRPYGTATGHRLYEYIYDENGRLRFVSKGEAGNALDHAIYSYYADDRLRSLRLGDSALSLPAQVIDYSYDAAGRLISINDPSSVSTEPISPDDHFGMSLLYSDSAFTFNNGRVRRIETSNTNIPTGGSVSHVHEFQYNEMGWLSVADHSPRGINESEDREFSYSYLGNRTGAVIDGDTLQYHYCTTCGDGTARLDSITGFGLSKMYGYDCLGNLTSWVFPGAAYPGIYAGFGYDYRNLLTSATQPTSVQGGDPSQHTMTYNESGLRIVKSFCYDYLDTCGTWDTLPMPRGMMGAAGAGGEGGSGGGSFPCTKTTCTETFYLYDGPILLATFDGDDNILDMFVNGQGGRIATYYQNDDTRLFYFVNDHLGSQRVLVHKSLLGAPPFRHRASQFVNYHPFGGILESSGNVQSAFKFTGKEYDQEGSFDYYYFGARYYDPYLGQFTSIDKASQFASGYVYGGNNPLMGIDRDGNYFDALLLLLVVGGGTITGLDAMGDGGNLFDFLDGFACGAFQGTLIASTMFAAPAAPIDKLGFILRSGFQRATVASFGPKKGFTFFEAFAKGAIQGLISATRVGGALYGDRATPSSLGDNLAAQAFSTLANSSLDGHARLGIGPIMVPLEVGVTGRDVLRDNALSLASNSIALASSLVSGKGVRFSKNTLSFVGYFGKDVDMALWDSPIFPKGSHADMEEEYHVWQSRVFGIGHWDFWPSIYAQYLAISVQRPKWTFQKAMHYNWFEKDAKCCDHTPDYPPVTF